MSVVKKVSSVIPLIICVSCGGGDTPNDRVNLQALPSSDTSNIRNYEGLYEIALQPYTFRCTSGYTEEFERATGRFAVAQETGSITIYAGDVNSPYEGIVDNTGRFSASHSVNTIAGAQNYTYTYTLNGRFTETGWSGSYSAKGVGIGHTGSCSTETSFAGSLVN